ncbi:tRNA (adenosine(37)-N6)-threonylcarbamoyltransferase complex ATPase subunit type 1 TsaE [Patiriisocius sp. Uisw_047]|jgi:tRNA threonylcarbamoyladenosine biosynthesis protein TsaE|uniref:tRNA (adenosine(37)-N6)-threonylcarbamoyltransferase complex ATPase subunit type 1 TsaE n=1 Tax=Patiriisocius sp. Uisw_047 TaxID=3230969 RepID=UPI0039E801AC
MKQTFTIQELPQVAALILKGASTKNLLFYGEMGVGKTTLIKQLAIELNVKDTIGSPSFSIVNEYKAADDIIYHFDFYRIEDKIEALDIGVEEYFYSGHWNFIEWPEKIEGLLPENADKLYLTNNNNGSRTIKMIPTK